jgi:hypothetical protein
MFSGQTLRRSTQDSDESFAEREPLLSTCTTSVDTFPLLQLVRARVRDRIDSVMSWETLR